MVTSTVGAKLREPAWQLKTFLTQFHGCHTNLLLGKTLSKDKLAKLSARKTYILPWKMGNSERENRGTGI